MCRGECFSLNFSSTASRSAKTIVAGSVFFVTEVAFTTSNPEFYVYMPRKRYRNKMLYREMKSGLASLSAT